MTQDKMLTPEFISKKPVLAIVGQPNAGKSTLFNRLTRTRQALVFDKPGVTKDRQYGQVRVGAREFVLIDTAGWIENPEEKGLEKLMQQQVKMAIDEADLILLLFDARHSLSPLDERIVMDVRVSGKPFLCAVNKSEGLRSEKFTEFFSIGEPIFPIAAINGVGLKDLLSRICELFETKGFFKQEEPSLSLPEEALLQEVSFQKDTLVHADMPDSREIRREKMRVKKAEKLLERDIKNTLKLSEEKEGSDDESDADLIKYAQGQLKMPIQLAVIGRPNVGKSTLINQILGFERVIVSDIAGTTTDAIHIPFEHLKQIAKPMIKPMVIKKVNTKKLTTQANKTDADEKVEGFSSDETEHNQASHSQKYILIDTAGIRRRSKVSLTLEKFSISKTLEAIEEADVVLHMINAQEGFTEQDVHLIGLSIERGKAIVLAVNQWDAVDAYQKQMLKGDLERKLSFATFFDIHYISALKGTNVAAIFSSIEKAFLASLRHYNTSKLMALLKDIIYNRPPDNINGRLPKFKFISQTGVQPPHLMIQGNPVLGRLPDAYKRYLVASFRKKCHWYGTAVRLELIWQDNPYDEKIKQSGKELQKHCSIDTM